MGFALSIKLWEKLRIALSVGIDLKNPGGALDQSQFVTFATTATVPGVLLVHDPQSRPEFRTKRGKDRLRLVL